MRDGRFKTLGFSSTVLMGSAWHRFDGLRMAPFCRIKVRWMPSRGKSPQVYLRGMPHPSDPAGEGGRGSEAANGSGNGKIGQRGWH